MVLFATALAVYGCASPGARLDRQAAQKGLAVLTLDGGTHRLRAYAQPGWQEATALRIYLEGDGLPFITPVQPARDPHPHRALALELAIADPQPAVWIGRPCYHRDLKKGEACPQGLWTEGRYSDDVVSALVLAIEDLLGRAQESTGERPVELFGYSGGGVLAVLLAHRLPEVERIVTVAANIDLVAWTDLHAYSPLTSSLDPATLGAPPHEPRQEHIAGALDRNVPGALIEAVVGEWPNTRFLEIEAADHACCWLEGWPQLLSRLDEEFDSGSG